MKIMTNLACAVLLAAVCAVFASCKGGVSARDLALVETQASSARHVAEVSALRGESSATLEELTAKIVQVLSSRSDLRIVDRTKMDDVMAEAMFQESDWAESTTSATVGKAIAADLRVALTASGEKSIKVDFLDVNTLQSVSAVVSAENVGSLSSLSLAAFDAGGSKDFSLYGTWYCSGVRKSQTRYRAGDLEKITPFGRLRPVNAERGEYADLLGRKLRGIETMTIQDGSFVTFVLEKGEEINAEASFSPKEPYTAKQGGKEYSTLLVGKIRIRDDGGARLLEGNVYAKDGELAVHFGSQNGDGSGKAYFLMFEE
ncbi:MAG: hypothetical protein IJ717_02600 [Treponema sp.]|nr:hypothetical protein [Treponema sp.]